MSEAISIQPHAEAVWAIVQGGGGTLDESTIDRMQQEVVAAAAQKAEVPVILDMSRVNFVPSAGLGALVTLMRALKKEGRRFILVGLQPEVRTLIAITHLDKLLEIQASFDEALRRTRSV